VAREKKDHENKLTISNPRFGPKRNGKVEHSTVSPREQLKHCPTNVGVGKIYHCEE